MIDVSSIVIKKHPFIITSGNEEIHFMVSSTMYRIEDDINKFAATYSYNFPEKAQELHILFDDIFNLPEAVEITI
ncbi:MAG: hypothetical protein IPP79_20620 [Chitinophagaceae bacterium]|nr:hypothetical protein [Chitinophagaceae bacterium]